MAKDWAEKPLKEKREKKMSEDKVKKPKKEKRVKIVTPQDSDEFSDNSGFAPVSDPMDIDSNDAKVEKESKLKKEVQPKSDDDTSDSEQEKKEEKLKKAEKKAKKAAKIEANSFFTIDTNPMPVSKVPEPAESDSLSSSSERDSEKEKHDDTKRAKSKKSKKEKQGDSFTTPPSGLNRVERRRLQAIGKQRDTMRKELGIPLGTSDAAKEVELEAAVSKWTADYDDKQAIRMEKKRIRKQKDAEKLRNRKGKILSGRNLKERQKQLKKIEKKATKKSRKVDP